MSIGPEGEYHFFQHKNHVGKYMNIVITGYEVRENDITNGGRDFTVAFIRVGKMVKADKDTSKNVYREDGTYYHPRISENQLRKKGDLYWNSCELTGSKMSLLSVYWREIIPDIEDKHADIYEDGHFKLLAVKKEDGSGPHQTEYLWEIWEEFHRQDCILFNQPPQSPVTNVKDARLL